MKTTPIPLARILPAFLLFVLFLITTPARAAVQLTFSQRGNDVVITPTGPIAHWSPDVVAISSTVTPVPEPSTAALSALALGTFVSRRRRL